ncbi:MAG TPA: hypothetical protein VG222_09480 [Vicinamibacterales bacterium]|jgi:hypothetical protein|nr:hypothetical protein [Vicinamibacterales bacterium]
MRHDLGSDPKSVTLALATKGGLERVSEVFLDNRFNRPAIKVMVLMEQRGDGNTWAFHVLREGDRPIQNWNVPGQHRVQSIAI